jgi:hypothetical protein
MAFHLGFELPPVPELASDEEVLTPHEAEIIKRQIRKNADVIDGYVKRIDLFVNQEKYPHREKFVERIRERMFLLMEENDTFRRLLWRHYQGKVLPVKLRMAG